MKDEKKRSKHKVDMMEFYPWKKILADRLRGLLGVGDDKENIELMLNSNVSIFGMIDKWYLFKYKVHWMNWYNPREMEFGLYGHFKDGVVPKEFGEQAELEIGSEYHHFLVFQIHWTDATP